MNLALFSRLPPSLRRRAIGVTVEVESLWALGDSPERSPRLELLRGESERISREAAQYAPIQFNDAPGGAPKQRGRS